MKKLFLLTVLVFTMGINHLQSQPNKLEKYAFSEESDFRNYFSMTWDTLDPIEGIWTCSEIDFINTRDENLNYCRVAIIRDQYSKSRDFVEVVLKGGANKVWDNYAGRITAHFTKSSNSNIYISKQFGIDGTFSNQNFTFYEDGTFHSKGTRRVEYEGNIYTQQYDQFYVKLFPAGNYTKSKGNSPSTGSGFLLSKNGYVVTNYHVIENSNKVEVYFPASTKTYSAQIKLKDKGNDLVILELDNFSFFDISNDEIPYTLADQYNIKIGQESYSLGFPFGSILGTNASLSSGRITNLNGIEDNPKLLQINNNLQPGNSGGPLFNLNGELVGVVVSGLNAKYFYENAGIIPQNVNFAIKLDYLLPLLTQLGIGDEIKNRVNRLSNLKLEDQIDIVKFCIVQVNVK